MTPTDHNKMIGIMHLIYGGFFGLITLLFLGMTVLFGIALSSVPHNPNEPPPALFAGLMGIFVFIYGFLSLPSLIAGYGMLKKRSWSRLAGIIAAVFSAMSFPFGTALCVYSLWFFFGEAGRAFEAERTGADWRGALGSAPASSYGWEAQRPQPRENAYTPPPPPPSWRDEQ